LAKSTVDQFEVQTRTEPVRGLGVSLNTAVSVNVLGDRVGIYYALDAPAPTLRINGVIQKPGRQALVLPHGGNVSIVAGDSGFAGAAVLWPDTTRVVVSVFPGGGLDAAVSVAKGRAGKVVGLLGNFDGDSTNDMKTRSVESFGGQATSDGRVLGDS